MVNAHVHGDAVLRGSFTKPQDKRRCALRYRKLERRLGAGRDVVGSFREEEHFGASGSGFGHELDALLEIAL